MLSGKQCIDLFFYTFYSCTFYTYTFQMLRCSLLLETNLISIKGALFLAIFEADLIQLLLVLEKSLSHKKGSKSEFCSRLKKGDDHQELFYLGLSRERSVSY